MINAPSVTLQKKSCITSFKCSHVQIFWKTFSFWWFELVKENIAVTLKRYYTWASKIGLIYETIL